MLDVCSFESTFPHPLTVHVLVAVCFSFAAAFPLQLQEPVTVWLSVATYEHAEHVLVLLCVL